MLAIIDSSKFNYKNKIGEFKYIDIKELVNNIRNNTISEIPAKKGLNILNKIKNAEIIKHKRYTSKQKELLNLFNDLLFDAILTDKTLKSKSQKGKTLMSSKDDDDNENDKTLMSSKDNNNEMNKTLMSRKDDHDETMNQNNNNIVKQSNDYLDEIIDKSKSFEDQIKSIRKVENLNEYCFMNDYGDKELGFKIFKLKLAYLPNIIGKKIFKRTFGHTFETLANILINTRNKEENQIIVNNISENKKETLQRR